jgi:hypothetical protein
MTSNFEFWQALADMLSSILSGIAILLSVWIYQRVRKEVAYQNFDEIYMKLLETGMQNPDFRDATLTLNYKEQFNDKRLIQYEIYAFMCWNFCETIYDRGDKDLMNTWLCVIETENSLHRAWFDAKENHSKFKDGFRVFVLKEFS